MGRPSIYTPELGQAIADLIAENYTLREIEEIDGMPSRSTLSQWAVRHEDFSDKCARARIQQAHVIVEEMKETIEKVKNGEFTSDQARVILSGQQWIASKKNPKSYGDKVTLAGDAENPLFNLGKRLDDLRARKHKMIDVSPVEAAISAPLLGADLC